VLEEEVAEVQGKTNMLLGERGADILINRELCAEAHGVIVKNSECGRSDENLMSLGIGDRSIRLQESMGAFANQLTEEPPVPFIRRSAPFRWPITVNQTVVEHIRSLVSVVLIKFRTRPTKPDVVAEGRHSSDEAEHGPWEVRGWRDRIEPGLRTGQGETSECGALETSADLRRPVLESPSERGVKVRTRLNSGRRKDSMSNDGGQRKREGQVRRKAIPDQLAYGRLRTEIRVTTENSLVETPFALRVCRSRQPEYWAVVGSIRSQR